MTSEPFAGPMPVHRLGVKQGAQRQVQQGIEGLGGYGLPFVQLQAQNPGILAILAGDGERQAAIKQPVP